MKRYIVYVHINKYNNKKYVGVTSESNPNNRWRNGKGYQNQTLFWRSIQKYTFDGFEHIIWARGLSKDEANLMERDLIKSFKSNDKDFGYNLTSGGMLFYQHSEETKERISDKVTGEGNPFYGKQHTMETKNKISESLKGRIISQESIDKRKVYYEKHGHHMVGRKLSKETRDKQLKSHSKAIYQIDKQTGEIICEYTSILEAMKITGIDSSNISKVCRGKANQSGGFRWAYKYKQ